MNKRFRTPPSLISIVALRRMFGVSIASVFALTSLTINDGLFDTSVDAYFSMAYGGVIVLSVGQAVVPRFDGLLMATGALTTVTAILRMLWLGHLGVSGGGAPWMFGVVLVPVATIALLGSHPYAYPSVSSEVSVDPSE